MPLKMARGIVRMTIANGSGDDDNDCHSIQLMKMTPDVIKNKNIAVITV